VQQMRIHGLQPSRTLFACIQAVRPRRVGA
jgi:hypothetical protein